ncbi:MAG: SRPBCC family protein [Rhodoferax sp.]
MDSPAAPPATTRLAEGVVQVPAAVEQVFAHLDDVRHLTAHMEQPSWRMLWGCMRTTTDARQGRALGSHIQLEGAVLGLRLALDEVVVEYAPPWRKSWKTVGEPRLLLIGPYHMGFVLHALPAGGTQVQVWLRYAPPQGPWARLWARGLGPWYARWCVRQMLAVAQGLGSDAQG